MAKLVFVAQSGELTHSDEVRSSNVRIAAAAQSFRFGDDNAVPFLCECADIDCQQFVPVAIGAYYALLDTREWLLAPGHMADTLEPPRAAHG